MLGLVPATRHPRNRVRPISPDSATIGPMAPPADDPRQLRNPFRSEQDAFRLLLIVGLGVAAIALSWALVGVWLGAPVTVVLVVAASRATYRWLRISLADSPDQAL